MKHRATVFRLAHSLVVQRSPKTLPHCQYFTTSTSVPEDTSPRTTTNNHDVPILGASTSPHNNTVPREPGVIARNQILREVNSLVQARKNVEAEEFLRATDLTNVDEPIRLFNRILLGYSEVGSVVEMERLLALLIHKVDLPSPDVFSYNVCLKALPPHRASGILREMADRGIAETKSYNTVITSYCKEGKVNEAVGVLERLVQHDNMVKPDVLSFSPILSAFARGGRPEQSQLIMDGMKRIGVKPDVIAYSSIISAWSRSKNPDGPKKALQVLDTMQEEENLQPDAAIYNAVLSTFARKGNMADQAYNLLCRMKVKPNVVTYATVLLAYKNTPSVPVRAAQELLDEMMNRGLAPNVVVLTTMISLHAREGLADSAEAILDNMRCPNTVTYTAVVEAWAQSDRQDALDRATQLVTRMPKPNVMTFNTLIKVAEMCRAVTNKVETIRRIRETMRLRCEPNIRTFNAIFNTCGATDLEQTTEDQKLEAVEYAMECLAELRGDGNVNIDDYTYPSLFKVLSKLGASFDTMEQAFAACCQDNAVDSMVLAQLKRSACSKSELQALLGTNINVEDVRVQQLPRKWSRRKDRERQRRSGRR